MKNNQCLEVSYASNYFRRFVSFSRKFDSGGIVGVFRAFSCFGGRVFLERR